MNTPIDRMSTQNIHAMLDYLSEEVETAQSKAELSAVLSLEREMFHPSPVQSAVYGLSNIRAEVDHAAIVRAQSKLECTVHLEVPQILSETFHALSQRMRTLQDGDDPQTFANATSALTWLASGDVTVS